MEGKIHEEVFLDDKMIRIVCFDKFLFEVFSTYSYDWNPTKWIRDSIILCNEERKCDLSGEMNARVCS